MVLRTIHDSILAEIKEAILYIAAGYSVGQVSEQFELLCDYFQTLGICHFLEEIDQQQFQENLVRSGCARRYYLRKSRESGNTDDRRLALGRTQAFLDSVAAGNLPLARDIALLSPQTWHPEWEYEDDFCYYLFLHRVIEANRPVISAEMTALLQRFERALAGGRSPRLRLCQALIQRDTDRFRSSLLDLMATQQAELSSLLETLEPCPLTYVHYARSLVSIEGLALLRIAEEWGLRPRQETEDLPLCPDLAVLRSSPADYFDIFQGIERELMRGG
jgi:hypothetical protein